MMEPIYLFIHLAKTGGTTFIGNLYKHLDFDNTFVDIGTQGDMRRGYPESGKLEYHTHKQISKIKIAVGHSIYWNTQETFPNREPRFIIFIREPISRIISHYTFDSTEKEMSFTEWYCNLWVPNEMFLFLCDHLGEKTIYGVLEKLKLFWHIGLQENLDASLKIIFNELNIPSTYKNRRVAGKSENIVDDIQYSIERTIKSTYTPSSQEIEMVKKDHELDIWLYEHISKFLIDYKYRPRTFDIPETIL